MEGGKENSVSQNFKTNAEMILFGRDIKKSPNVWKPNCPTKKIIGQTLHADLKYVEEGEAPKMKKESLKLWK
jgi:hypothetical protein